MTTGDILAELALSLAGSGTERDEAVRELLLRAGDRRVAMVRAREMVGERMEASPDDKTASLAGELLEDALTRLAV